MYNAVAIQVTSMKGKFRNTNNNDSKILYNCTNGISIKSDKFVEYNELTKELCLRGSDIKKDFHIAIIRCNNKEEVIELVTKLKEAINEFNTNYNYGS